MIAIVAVLLLALLTVSQAASHNKLARKQPNHWVTKAVQARRSVDLSKITDPEVKKLIEKLNKAIRKAENARKIAYSFKKGTKKTTETATPTEETLSDASISNGATLKATAHLNIRSGPCTTNSVVRVLSPGHTATFTGQTAAGCGYTWYSINGGWVASNFVTVVGGGGGGGGGKMSNADALNKVRSAGITIYNQICPNRNSVRCTSLDQVNTRTIDMIVTLKRASGCPINITGGTEVGHAIIPLSHGNGFKLDISLNSCINKYITSSFPYIGRRGDGALMYKASSGSIYAHEGNHWDITYP